MLSFVLALTATDLECLRAFYNSTNGEKWSCNTNWETNDHCNYWGISCNAAGQVTEISLPNNIISGSLPTCFNTSFPELTVLNLQQNSLSGNYVPHSKLKALSLGKTMLNVHTMKLEGLNLTSLNLDLLNLKYKPFPSSLLSQLTTLSIWGCGLVASPGSFTNKEITKLNIIGNDFSEVRLDLGSEELQQFLIGDSNLSLGFTKANVGTARDIALQNVDMREAELWPLESFDCVNCSFTAVHDKAAELRIYNVPYNNIHGLSPSRTEIEALLAGPALIYNLNGNPLFCRADGMEAFDCTYLRPVRASGGTVFFETADFVNRLPVEVMNDQLRVETAGEPLECVFAPVEDDLHTVEAQCTTDELELDQITVFYNNSVVSNSKIAGKRVAAIEHDPTTADATDGFRLTVEVTGVSQCPYYQLFFEVMYKPFIEAYPELNKLVRFVYISLMTPSSALASRGLTMHGMAEAYQDMYKICIEEVAPQEKFLRYEMCLIEKANAQDSSYKCLLEVGLLQAVRECVSTRGAGLGRQHMERYVQLGSNASPLVFIKGAMVDFDWEEGPEAYARILCGYDELRDTAACAGIDTE